MTKRTNQKLKTKQMVTTFYVGLVIAVFVGLMIALYFKNDAIYDGEALQVDDQDIVAIIEEYQSEDATRKGITLDSRTSALPSTQKPAWKKFAVRPEPTISPKVVVIIDDLGLDEQATQLLVSMPGPYTLAFLPYAENLPSQTARVKKAGHELMVHLPMQSHRTTADPGANALLKNLSFDEFGQRMEWNLTQFEGFVGVNNHMGSMLTEDPALMVRLMARLRHDGLLFVDSLTTPKSVGERAAKAINVPFLSRDVFLDNERNQTYIQRQLATVERIAKLRGYAVAIGHPYPETLAALTKWQKSLGFKGLRLVPVSQIMAEKIDKSTLTALEETN